MKVIPSVKPETTGGSANVPGVPYPPHGPVSIVEAVVYFLKRLITRKGVYK